MSRAGAALIKKHLAALAGSRQVALPPAGELLEALVAAGEPASDHAGGARFAAPQNTTPPGPGPRQDGSAASRASTVPRAGGSDRAEEGGEAPGAAVGEPGGASGAPGAASGEAARMLEAARSEALRIQREARALAEKEGWEAGFAAGQQAARAEVRRECEEAMRRALGILEEARRERLALLRQSHRDVVRMALDLAARILEREVSLSPEVVREQAAALLRRLEQGEKATLHVHPEDVEVIGPWLPELASSCGAGLDVVPDPAVGRGGVMVETQHGYLDGRLDRQLRRLGEALLAWVQALPGPGEGDEDPAAAGAAENRGAGGDGDGPRTG